MPGKAVTRFGLIAVVSLGVFAGAAETAHAERPPNQINGPRANNSAPPLFISEADLDMGDVAPRSKMTKTVRIRNLGDEAVVITETKGDCSCTALINDGYVVIKPGDDAEMEIAVETRDMGVQTKKIRIICEGYARPYEAMVRTNITEAVEVNPNGVKALIQPMGILTLKSIDDEAFEVVSVHGDEPQFVGFDPEEDGPVSVYRVVYDFSGLSKEDMPGVVMVETTHPDAPFIAIRNFAKDPQAGAPDKAGPDKTNWRTDYDFEYIPRLTPGESAEIEVRVAKAGRVSREQTLHVSSDNEMLSVEIVEADQDADPKWTIATVRVTASPSAIGFQAAALEFTLGEGRACEVQLFTRVVGG